MELQKGECLLKLAYRPPLSNEQRNHRQRLDHHSYGYMRIEDPAGKVCLASLPKQISREFFIYLVLRFFLNTSSAKPVSNKSNPEDSGTWTIFLVRVTL